MDNAQKRISILRMPHNREKLLAGADPAGSLPEEFGAFIEYPGV